MSDQIPVSSPAPAPAPAPAAAQTDNSYPPFAAGIQVSSQDFFSYLNADKRKGFIGYTVRYNPLSATSGELVIRTFKDGDGAIKFYVNSANVVSLVQPS